MTLHEAITFAVTDHPDRFIGAMHVAIKEAQTEELNAAYERIKTVEVCLMEVEAYIEHLVAHGCEDMWMLEKIAAVLDTSIRG